MIKDICNSEHYVWGNKCDGWHLVNSPTLSIIQEMMPPATSESWHYHTCAQQFFFILSGTATFETEGEAFQVQHGKGFHIPPGRRHRIANHTDAMLEFIVISEPHSHVDRSVP